MSKFSPVFKSKGRIRDSDCQLSQVNVEASHIHSITELTHKFCDPKLIPFNVWKCQFDIYGNTSSAALAHWIRWNFAYDYGLRDFNKTDQIRNQTN